MGSYVFRWPYPANDVHVSGTFDDWGKSEKMDRVGDHWEKEVELPSADEKVFYKFVVDDEWVVDDKAPQEGDGHWNINNVLFPHQITPKPKPEPKPEPTAVASESQSNERSNETSDHVPGAFPETPFNDNQTFSVHPIPASSGIGNPISLPAGAPLPNQKDVTSNTIDSTVTTSKEAYEAGSTIPPPSEKEASEYSINPFPATSGAGNPVSVPAGAPLPSQKEVTSNTIGSAVTTSKEDYENSGAGTELPEPKADDSSAFSVNPIPATSGVGNPVHVPAGSSLPAQKDITSNTVGSAVTTSKEDYENSGAGTAPPERETDDPSTFSVKPIPASSGFGNPITLAPGAPIPNQKDITPHTVESTVTTSKEDYENSGSGLPNFAAGAAIGALGGAAAASAFSVPKEKKNLIPESSLPMGGTKLDTTDAGPFIRSSGPGTTTGDLASKAPLESPSFIGSIGPDASTAKLASELEIPLRTSRSISTSGPPTTSSGLAAKSHRETDPTISSSGLGTTTGDLASKVPLENASTIRSSGPDTTTGELASKAPLESDPTLKSSGPKSTTGSLASSVPLETDPTIRSSGPGTTTADLAAKALMEDDSTTRSGAAGSTTADIASRALMDREPTIRSSGPGTTTGDLASKVPLEDDSTIKSSGPGTTTGDLASKVPLENDPTIKSSGPGTTTGDLASKVPLENDSTIKSSGPGTTTGDLASKVPLEADSTDKSESPKTMNGGLAAAGGLVAASALAAGGAVVAGGALVAGGVLAAGGLLEHNKSSATSDEVKTSPDVPEIVQKSIASAHQAPEAASSSEAVKEKTDFEKELLSKTHTSQASGDSMSAAALSSSVPAIVQKSIATSHEAPEAASSSEAVREKAGVEKELLSKTHTSQALGDSIMSAAAPSSSVPAIVQKSIATSHEAPEAASSSEAVREKAGVEKELLSKTHTSQASGDSMSAAALSSSVPAIVQKSIATSHEAPEAASSSEAVREKAGVEKELLSKATGGQSLSEPVSADATSSNVPVVVQQSIAKSHQTPEAATSTEAVREKAEVEKELLSRTTSGEALGASTDAPSSSVPAIVQKSIASAHEAPEAASSSGAVKEKADFEKELLSKTHTSQASGESASVAAEQTSYYGLATSVPATVEKSMQQSHAAPEAAAEPSAVAEKSAFEKELLSKVPSTDEAGEPAPTIAAATSPTAPTSTSAAGVATSITDGKTANEPVPDTDTSSAARGLSAGELAGGAVVGGAAAAGAAALAARHRNADIEPPRVADSQKPDITTEASPATASKVSVPGQSRYPAAAIADGAAGASTAAFSKSSAPVEKSEGATTEYAPIRTTAPAPGVSSMAGAALSDGTEDPTLADEPAVKMMNHKEGVTSSTSPTATAAATTATSTVAPTGESTVHDITTTSAPTTKAPVVTAPIATTSATTTSATERPKTPPSKHVTGSSTAGTHDPSSVVAAAGIPSLTSAGTQAGSTDTKKDAGFSTAAANTAFATSSAPVTPAKKPIQGSAVNSPATSTATSTATDKKKKRHSLRAFIKKIFD